MMILGNKNSKFTPLVLLLGLVMLLSACGRSAEQYPICFEYEDKTADTLYAYTIPMEAAVQKALEEQYPQGRIGYLLPVRTPKHVSAKIGSDQQYWCTLHDHEGNLEGYVMVLEEKGRVFLLNTVGPVDWSGLSGYTSPDNPLTVYKENIWYFAMIGQAAYYIDSKPDCEIQKTDALKEYDAALTVCDIMHK